MHVTVNWTCVPGSVCAIVREHKKKEIGEEKERITKASKHIHKNTHSHTIESESEFSLFEKGNFSNLNAITIAYIFRHFLLSRSSPCSTSLSLLEGGTINTKTNTETYTPPQPKTQQPYVLYINNIEMGDRGLMNN